MNTPDDEETPGQEIERGAMLIDRLAAVGMGTVPREAFEGLTQEHWRIWLCEPDIDRFPPEMEHLKKFTLGSE